MLYAQTMRIIDILYCVKLHCNFDCFRLVLTVKKYYNGRQLKIFRSVYKNFHSLLTHSLKESKVGGNIIDFIFEEKLINCFIRKSLKTCFLEITLKTRCFKRCCFFCLKLVRLIENCRRRFFLICTLLISTCLNMLQF